MPTWLTEKVATVLTILARSSQQRGLSLLDSGFTTVCTLRRCGGEARSAGSNESY